jgi:hypothetical protein
MTGPELIRQYILAMTGTDIGGIAPPRNDIELLLYQHALAIAQAWHQANATGKTA